MIVSSLSHCRAAPLLSLSAVENKEKCFYLYLAGYKMLRGLHTKKMALTRV